MVGEKKTIKVPEEDGLTADTSKCASKLLYGIYGTMDVSQNDIVVPTHNEVDQKKMNKFIGVLVY